MNAILKYDVLFGKSLRDIRKEGFKWQQYSV